jgi:Polysaccharide deacetylase
MNTHKTSPQRKQGPLAFSLALACAAGWLALWSPVLAQPPKASPGNRLAYLDELDPYYPHAKFPKLITPQWVGEDGVEAVVILAIDDMREPAKYEAFLRPILRRLQKIDGRAPVSIMTCNVNPKDPQLQTWLKEGLSLECHTIDHPCPFFKQGFEKAKSTYDRCIDLMNEIPNNKPVAFRMPCCDSLNTPSPRHWAEIFNKTTAKGNFLSIDSSVFVYYTSDDPELPKSLTLDADGKERFKRYLPMDRSFVNTIENYPYPYVIGNLCWEFPCMTPSDWEAQHLQKSNNPKTVEDWKAALDCTVIKQGVMTMVFHPHGWIRNDQLVELIDYAVAKHGKKVKFLTFKDALERLNKNLLHDNELRSRLSTTEARLVDLDNDGYLDVVIVKDEARGADYVRVQESYRWTPKGTGGEWAGFLSRHNGQAPAHRFEISNEIARTLPFPVPPGTKLIWEVPRRGSDIGLRFVDLDGDGKLDIIFSNEKEYGIYLFTDMEKGWSRKVLHRKRGEPGASATGGAPADELPMISRHGTNNGFWVHSGYLWWSNEDTVLLKDHVDRRKIADLLRGAK